MTVRFYTDTAKPEGDVERLKVFAPADARTTGSKVDDPEGVAFKYEVLEQKAPDNARGLRFSKLYVTAVSAPSLRP